jgi:hypothetical protein
VSRAELALQVDAMHVRMGDLMLGRLAGGTMALVPASAGPLRNIDVEWVIERAEDWLMPFSKSLQGSELHVHDGQGQLRQYLGAPLSLEPSDIERAFTRAADDIAFGRPVERELLAGLVLLRELVHHGALSRVVME